MDALSLFLNNRLKERIESRLERYADARNISVAQLKCAGLRREYEYLPSTYDFEVKHTSVFGPYGTARANWRLAWHHYRVAMRQEESAYSTDDMFPFIKMYCASEGYPHFIEYANKNYHATRATDTKVDSHLHALMAHLEQCYQASYRGSNDYAPDLPNKLPR